MRIGVLQWLLIGLLSGTGVARDGLGQSILNHEVTVRLTNLPLKEAIDQLQTQTKVRFVYSSRIRLAERVSLMADSEKLASVLNRLLSPLQITYRVINDQIALTSLTGKAASGNDTSVPTDESVAADRSDPPAPTETPRAATTRSRCTR